MTDYSLENLDQFHGFQIDAYLVALQGWKRGLQLKFHTRRPDDVYFANDTIPNEFPGVVFTLSNDKKSHTFYRTRGDLTSDSAVDLCADKLLFKRHLEAHHINTPEGEMFHIDNKEDMLNYADSIGYPVVLKPATGSMGRGVTSNIKDARELAVEVDTLRENFPEYKQVLVETYFIGEDYRIYVTGDKVVAAYTRDAAHVYGDGVSSIEVLIEKANNERKLNPNTRNKLITIDHDILMHLKMQDVNLETVVPKQQKIILRSIPNISLGGNPKDVTKTLPGHINNAVVRAVQSINGLPNAGVDVLINDDGDYTIIEMNSVAVITSHVFPIDGDAIDVPAHIIDYYFPETIDNKRTSVTFNYSQVLTDLARGVYKELEVKSPPNDINGSVRLSFQSNVPWINPERVQAMLQMYDFHGYIKHKDNHYTLTITTHGNINLDTLTARLKQRYLIEDIQQSKGDLPITQTGIYIKY